jgi:hypothetical protein
VHTAQLDDINFALREAVHRDLPRGQSGSITPGLRSRYVTAAQNFVGAMIVLLPFIMAFVVPLVMQLKVTNGKLRVRLYRDKNMPFPGYDSRVISTVCHWRSDEDDTSHKAIRWGVVIQPSGAGMDAAGHCSFSSSEVEHPQRGYYYTGILGIP